MPFWAFLGIVPNLAEERAKMEKIVTYPLQDQPVQVALWQERQVFRIIAKK
jgi:hypothetical protein